MGSSNKNKAIQQYNKYKSGLKKELADRVYNDFIKENAGNIINHKDRSYKIMPDGSWKRITPKHEIIRNSKDYK